ncbi:unnamed protein product [Lampetra fluviatilis]
MPSQPPAPPGEVSGCSSRKPDDRAPELMEPAACIYSLAGAATTDHTMSPDGSCLYSVVNMDNKERKKKKTKEKNEHQDASGIYSLVNASSS